jgi:ubiquinone/menaquinone biosynthesis C-methylase UbiE/DNA-binding transcriptional ArsR family regulator
MKHARSNQLSAHLAVLSDPARLRVLRLLEREELSVGELARVLQLPQSTVSRHLKVLADDDGAGSNGAGWLSRRDRGTASFYRLLLDDLALPARQLWVTVREQLAAGEDHGLAAEFAEDLRRLTAVLNDRRMDTQTFFGQAAGEWDEVRNELFGQAFTVQSLLNMLPPGWTVADLGCGTGNAAECLAPVVKRVLAVDQSEPMLAAAKKRLSGSSNVEFLRGELQALPIETGSVDAAVSVLVLHHLPDPQPAIREMARILRPGGVALVVDMVSHNREIFKKTMGHRWLGFGVPEMIRWMSESGLERARFSVLPSDSSAKGPGLFACSARRPEKGEVGVGGRK